MPRHKRTLLWICFLAAFTSHLFAADYYVSTAGSDANDGLSKAGAFATIQKGVDAIEPGDTLVIAPGEYHESVRREGIGSAAATTTIRAEIPGTVTLRGDVPVTGFRKAEGSRFAWVAELQLSGKVHAVNETDTGRIFEPMPNATELDFLPGMFHHDAEAGKLYISTSDMRSADGHRYTASVIPTHGFYLSDAKRVVVEGLAVTGFNATEQMPRRDQTQYSVWGMYIHNAKDCVIRDCRAWLNGQGISVASADPSCGDNVIERCVAWANVSQFGTGDRGGITLHRTRRDTIRDSVAYRNGHYGINIRSSGQLGGDLEEKDKSVLLRNFAWGNGMADIKIKTGYDNPHETVRSVGWKPSNDYDPVHCLLGTGHGYTSLDNIYLDREEDLHMQAEFADPDNHDYRLQATSRFRGAAPDGGDRGPFPYEENIFYVKPDGDDTADGLSVGSAWRTLARATRDLEAGDTLYLLPGEYKEALQLRARGEEGSPVSIRGRGAEAVRIADEIRTSDSRHVEFSRLRFTGGAAVSDSANVSFEKCLFGGDRVGLAVESTHRLAARHCEFLAGVGASLAMRDCSEGFLSGNLYENQAGVAVDVDRAEAILYSDYNGYAQPSRAWRVGGELRSVEQLAPAFGNHSIGVSRTVSRTQDIASPTLALAATSGPYRKPLGPHREKLPEAAMRLADGPIAHSTSATTANIEWFTSLPAICEVAWGTTPACENEDTFGVDYFGSYSLTGLEPGRNYYFRIKSLRVPRELADRIDAEPVELDSAPIAFATLEADPIPKTYFVAPDGDNANAGTSRGDAWRTIQFAADNLNAGDTVLIAGGTYEERVRIRATGASDAPITFASLPGEKVVLSGAGKKLNKAFFATAKRNLRFDGLYFADSSREPLQGWTLRLSSEFSLYKCGDIHIARCFSDGRGGYSARFVVAHHTDNLSIENSVTMNKMSGALMLIQCPGLRIEKSVLARSLTGSYVLSNTSDQKAAVENTIFTDMLQKKVASNVPLFYGHGGTGWTHRNNCYYLRIPASERRLVGNSTIENLRDRILDPLFGNPRFKDDPSDEDTFGIDQMMNPGYPLDFDSFFATNPEVLERGMGLDPEAFEDFRFGENP